MQKSSRISANTHFTASEGSIRQRTIFYVFAIPVRLILECGGNML